MVLAHSADAPATVTYPATVGTEVADDLAIGQALVVHRLYRPVRITYQDYPPDPDIGHVSLLPLPQRSILGVFDAQAHVDHSLALLDVTHHLALVVRAEDRQGVIDLSRG